MHLMLRFEGQLWFESGNYSIVKAAAGCTCISHCCIHELSVMVEERLMTDDWYKFCATLTVLEFNGCRVCPGTTAGRCCTCPCCEPGLRKKLAAVMYATKSFRHAHSREACGPNHSRHGKRMVPGGQALPGRLSVHAAREVRMRHANRSTRIKPQIKIGCSTV